MMLISSGCEGQVDLCTGSRPLRSRFIAHPLPRGIDPRQVQVSELVSELDTRPVRAGDKSPDRKGVVRVVDVACP